MHASGPDSKLVRSLFRGVAAVLAFGLILMTVACGSGAEDGKKGATSQPKSTDGTSEDGDSEKSDGASKSDADSSDTDGKTAGYQPTGSVDRGRALVMQKCAMCHKVEGRGNTMFGAPDMNQYYKGRLLDLMANYPDHIERLKNINMQRYEANKEKIDAVLEAEDPTEKLALWFKYYTQQPTFDREQSKMTVSFNNLSDEQLDDIVAYVLSLEGR